MQWTASLTSRKRGLLTLQGISDALDGLEVSFLETGTVVGENCGALILRHTRAHDGARSVLPKVQAQLEVARTCIVGVLN